MLELAYQNISHFRLKYISSCMHLCRIWAFERASSCFSNCVVKVKVWAFLFKLIDIGISIIVMLWTSQYFIPSTSRMLWAFETIFYLICCERKHYEVEEINGFAFFSSYCFIV